MKQFFLSFQWPKSLSELIESFENNLQEQNVEGKQMKQKWSESQSEQTLKIYYNNQSNYLLRKFKI